MRSRPPASKPDSKADAAATAAATAAVVAATRVARTAFGFDCFDFGVRSESVTCVGEAQTDGPTAADFSELLWAMGSPTTGGGTSIAGGAFSDERRTSQSTTG